MSTNDHEYTFRTKVFGGYPSIDRPNPGFDCEIGKRYSMECTISEDKAEYSIDGQTYAIAYFSDQDNISTEGYFGWALYQRTEEKLIDSVRYTQLGQQKGHYISYKNAPSNWKLDNEKPPPAKKYFVDAKYDSETRTFTGRIDWRPKAFYGDSVRDYTL